MSRVVLSRGKVLLPIVALTIMSAASPALAYVGPGLGAGAIAVVLGILGSIGLALVAIFYYPIKRMMKKKKAAATPAASASVTDETAPRDSAPEK